MLSISSIVMNDNILENEPGNEGRYSNNQEGYQTNEGYANIVRLGNLQHAMIDMLKSPPECFKEIIQEC